MPKLLLEDTCEFVPRDRTKLSEAVKGRSGAFPLSIPGRLSVCDSINGNNRRYPKRVWEKNINDPKSPLQEKIAKRAAFGLLEHPKDGKVDLNSPISHLVTKVLIEGSEVMGEITILNTADGLKLTALIEGGYNPLVSSRGYGSVVRGADGIDEVQDDFICESWDVVHTPSFANAELFVPRTEAKVEPEVKLETKPVTAVTPAPAQKVESLTVTGQSPGTVTQTNTLNEASASFVKQTTVKIQTMDLKSLNESVQLLRATDPSKLDPARFAEGISRIHQIHRDIAALVAEDSKSSWDGTRLHQDLDAIEKSWVETLRAPVAEVAQLREQQTRTLRVVKAVAETGLSLKKQLGEAKVLVAESKKKITETLTRGKGWMERALTAEKSTNLLEHKFDVACSALDIMTERYHADTSALGRRVLNLEFKPTDDKLIARIKECKTAKELAVIREELKPKTAAPAVNETKPAVTAVAAAPKAEVKAESVASVSAAVSLATPVLVTEVKKTDTTTYIAESTLNRPFTVAESLQVGKDLSKTV